MKERLSLNEYRICPLSRKGKGKKQLSVPPFPISKAQKCSWHAATSPWEGQTLPVSARTSQMEMALGWFSGGKKKNRLESWGGLWCACALCKEKLCMATSRSGLDGK